MPTIDPVYVQQLLNAIDKMKQEMLLAMLESCAAVSRSSPRAEEYRNQWLDAKARLDTLRASGINVPNLIAADDLDQWLRIFLGSHVHPNQFPPTQQQMVEHCKIHQKQLFGAITEPLEAAFKKYNVNNESPKELMNDIRLRFSHNKPSLTDATLAGLHEKIRARFEPLFKNGHLDEAVLAAMKAVEEELRAKINAEPGCCGVDVVDWAIPQQSPPLTFSQVASEQQAAHFLFRGAVGFIRNPQAHRFIEIDDRQEAVEQLAFASMLMRMLDRAKTSLSPGNP